MKEKVYILLPVHNRIDVTKKFIKCLEKQLYDDTQLVLIDDGSKDGSGEMVKGRVKDLAIITGTGSWWWAGCLNKGIAWLKNNGASDHDIILIINDDVLIGPEFISTGVKLLSIMPQTLLLARFREPHTGKIQETGVHADLKRVSFSIASSPDEINCLSTRGLFIRWKDMRDIGNFRSILLPHYATDYEFTIRAKKKGYHLATDTSLYLTFSPETTGIRKIEPDTFWNCCVRLFNKRYTNNPIYWTNMVILICPWQWVIPNILKMWVRAVIDLAQCTKKYNRED